MLENKIFFADKILADRERYNFTEEDKKYIDQLAEKYANVMKFASKILFSKGSLEKFSKTKMESHLISSKNKTEALSNFVKESMREYIIRKEYDYFISKYKD